MAAGDGFKTWQTGDVLSADDVNNYLMQGVWVFDDAADRTAQVTSPAEGNVSYLRDTNAIEKYDGSSWVAIGGSSPLTTKGDLYTYSTTDARLPVGTNGQVLKADSSTATGLVWGSAAGAYTLITANSFTSSSSVTIDSVFTSTYQNYYIHVNVISSQNCVIQGRMRASAADYTGSGHRGAAYWYDHGGTGGSLSNVTDRWRFINCIGSQQRGFGFFLNGANVADWTTCHGTGLGASNAFGQQAATLIGYNVETSTQYDGINIYPDGGTITGTVRIYGLANS